MKISSIYTYPIKSLRPCSLQEAQLTQHGLKHDRRFMLLQVLEDGTHKNMHVSHYSELVLFHTQLDFTNTKDGIIAVTYKPPKGDAMSITIPQEPDVATLSRIAVDMHKSPTMAYAMDKQYCDWFSACLGYQVVLAYLGPQYREVLMSNSREAPTPSRTWLGSFAIAASTMLAGPEDSLTRQITFADCAPYLIVSERSMDDVHHRLPDGELMDITKFRSNIIVSGAEKPWEEDYWGSLCINGSTKIECIHNCNRCQSLNVDYATGKPGTGESGKILSKLQKDRRVDPGAKYSPIFGRYSFLSPPCEGDIIRVGDEVKVSRWNERRTTFDWPGLSTAA